MVKGPRIVVIGGGTGLGTILRGLKLITSHLTAIVTVADDGGSSGRLRRDYGMLPPGDIRNCLVALADIEPLMERLMQYRFTGDSELAGHSFGNLFLAAMTEITGDFEVAIKEFSNILAVRGRVLPATLANVTLNAELEDGRIVCGESNVAKLKVPIRRLTLEPKNCTPVPEAIAAIKDADVIVLGPGSLYTSVIPNLLVREIAQTIRDSGALKIYICNAMTQRGETVNYSASDHLQAIIDHAGPGLIDLAIINTDPIPQEMLKRYAEEGSQPVLADLDKVRSMGITPLGAKIIVKSNFIRHDAGKLAEMILRLAQTTNIGFGLGRLIPKHLYKFFKGISGVFLGKMS